MLQSAVNMSAVYLYVVNATTMSELYRQKLFDLNFQDSTGIACSVYNYNGLDCSVHDCSILCCSVPNLTYYDHLSNLLLNQIN